MAKAEKPRPEKLGFEKKLGYEALALHAGQQPDPATCARAQPIYMTTSYLFESTDHAASFFSIEVPGHIHSRISHPTVAVFEVRPATYQQFSREALAAPIFRVRSELRRGS